jgi:hypothetical protein
VDCGRGGLRTWWTEDAVDWNAVDWKVDQDALDLGSAGSGYAGCCRPYATGLGSLSQYVQDRNMG